MSAFKPLTLFFPWIAQGNVSKPENKYLQPISPMTVWLHCFFCGGGLRFNFQLVNLLLTHFKSTSNIAYLLCYR